jgi:replicative superfamily II helicase
MKTVLIPTDYRTESLQYIPQLLSKFYPEEVDVVMVHMMSVTDCMRELLMLSRRSAEYKHISDDFYQTCIDLKNQYKRQLNNIRLEFFYGNTTAVLKNFIEANDIDAVLQLTGYEYRMLNKMSINPAEMLDRCKKLVKIHTMELEKKTAALPQEVIEETVSEPLLSEQYA